MSNNHVSQHFFSLRRLCKSLQAVHPLEAVLTLHSTYYLSHILFVHCSLCTQQYYVNRIVFAIDRKDSVKPGSGYITTPWVKKRLYTSAMKTVGRNKKQKSFPDAKVTFIIVNIDANFHSHKRLLFGNHSKILNIINNSKQILFISAIVSRQCIEFITLKLSLNVLTVRGFS